MLPELTDGSLSYFYTDGLTAGSIRIRRLIFTSESLNLLGVDLNGHR